MRAKDAVGRYGERVAAEHLRRSGFELLDRNWRCRRGELDIVALDGDCLVAVEVKTRRSMRAGHPFEAVDARKLTRVRQLLCAWAADHRDGWWPQLRVDVVAVLPARRGAAAVEHLRGVA